MKAIVIISACVILAVALRMLDVFSSSRNIKSVGSKSNRNSRNISKVDINDPESVNEALKAYKDLAD